MPQTRLVKALLQPEAYPEPVEAVELVETHISFIFLTGRHAYKVKRPVDYGFLDFTTLEKRRLFCHREVELNRRLSPDVYLGVSEIREQDGRYRVDGPGKTVEYAVKMQQMPRDQAMAALIKAGKVSRRDVARLAKRIARFHAQAAASPEITAIGGLETVRENVGDNLRQTEPYVGRCISRETYEDLEAYSQSFLDAKEALFRRRAAEGRIRDCHGDLHTAQIYLENGIHFLDCIEFNDQFRYCDVAEDIAFLAMDLDHLRRPDLSRQLVQAYVDASGDPGVMCLLDFFKAYRACVRGKVSAFLLNDADLPKDQRRESLATARAYFRLARSYARPCAGPALVLVAGLMGSGKSTVAARLARRWGMERLASDLVRKELAGIAAHEHRFEAFGQGLYSPAFSRRTYDTMLQRAAPLLKKGRSVVIDATFHRAEDRRRALETAQRCGAQAWLVECTLPEQAARARLVRRVERGDSPSDGRWELYHQQRKAWEPVTEVPADRHVRLDTTGAPEETMRELVKALYAKALGHDSQGEPGGRAAS